jgi:hypothetical protein
VNPDEEYLPLPLWVKVLLKFCRLLACVVDEDEAHIEACQALLEDSV